MIISIFTDGACKGNGQCNQSPGGWGAVLEDPSGNQLHLAGFSPDTTNQRMELKAAIEGLRALKRPSQVNLYTDSKYVQQGFTEWLVGWKAQGWTNAKKKPIANKDLWLELDGITAAHALQIVWVKGHSKNPNNDLADNLANRGARGEAVHQYKRVSS